MCVYIYVCVYVCMYILFSELTKGLTGVLSGAITKGLSGLGNILGKRGFKDDLKALEKQALLQAAGSLTNGNQFILYSLCCYISDITVLWTMGTFKFQEEGLDLQA